MELTGCERLNETPDLSDQDDVSSAAGRDRSDCRNTDRSGWVIRIVSDSTPVALAQIFGLLATFSVVPRYSSSTILDANTITLMLEFLDVAPNRTDLLRRKISQLTSVVSIMGGH